MYKWKRSVLPIAILLWAIGFTLKAEPMDSVRISLLTCSPGSEIYTLFGHTALRYENPSRDIDVVFNYGMFSFRAPNFIWRFVKGETDYMLGINEYSYFQEEYTERESAVYQQTLNLLPEEKRKLIEFLEWNSRKENRVYRYNFFFDNCTTRARDRIEDCIQGKVRYEWNTRELSFRKIVHQYTKGHEWAQFGMDVCIGSQADAPIDNRTQMFAPFYLLHAVDSAHIVGIDGQERPLAEEAETIIPVMGNTDKTEHYWLAPSQAGWLLLLITGIISLYGFCRKKMFWGLDILLFGAAGVAGCIIAFLVFFSVHPTVSPNYMLLVLHPIHLAYLPIQTYFSIRRKKDWYHWANGIVLTGFVLLFGHFPQEFNLAVLPISLCLWLRSATHVAWYYRYKE